MRAPLEERSDPHRKSACMRAYVLLVASVAALGGLLFGYDTGVSQKLSPVWTLIAAKLPPGKPASTAWAPANVMPDDTLTNSRMLIDMSSDKRPGITDGMKVDSRGNIWESGPTGVWVITPQGQHIGTILVPELVANVEFGDADHRTLYIAARSSVYKIRINIPGIP